MNFNHIRNLGNPKHGADAVPRSFMDNIITEVEEKVEKVKEKIDKRKQLITASASFHGDLISGDYQFTWGGQSMESYKKHDMFSGFLVPSSGYIKKFVVLTTGLKINAPKGRDILEFIVYDIGYNTHIPLFTLVLIRHKQEPVDIGTLYFYFIDYGLGRSGEMDFVFKYNPNFEEKDLRTVGAKDIINIRSEFNSIKINENRIMVTDVNYKFVTIDFFTYLATVLIELDPLDEEDD